MKKLRMVLLAGLLIAALCAPAHAWEFAMTGNFQWTYEAFDQAGPNGFFGPQGVASAGLAGLGATSNWFYPNFWAGARLLSGTQYGMLGELNSRVIWSRMVLNPEIRVNPAIRLRAQYWVGGFQTWNGGGSGGTTIDAAGTVFGNLIGSDTDQGNSVYLLQQTGNAITRPLSTGQWNMLWATAQTPWGILVFGKRPFAFGMGLTADGEHTLSSESLALIAPYGPLRIGVSIHPWRQATFLDAARNINTNTGVGQLGQIVTNTTAPRSIKFWEGGSQRLTLPQTGGFVTYSNGPLDAGIVWELFQEHQDPNIQSTKVAGAVGAPTVDEVVEDGIAYVKYNNGRFFFNSEIGWWRWNTRFQPGANAVLPEVPVVGPNGVGIGSIYQPVNNEGWQFATELGALCGPSKLSLLYSWIPGPDRRQGIWMSRSSWNDIAYGNVPCNVMLFLPYSYLMTYQYASGLNFRNALGEGGLTDATGVGARLDYAVAANLNWYGSFFWAWRNSGAWPWGVLTIDQGTTGAAPNVGINGANAVQVYGIDVQGGAAPQNGGVAGNFAPNIPDNNLGYELTTGIDWKLLEGLTMNMRAAFWQPGEWFKFACLDRSQVATTHAMGNTHIGLNSIAGEGIIAGFGINPSRSIDPIWAFTGSLNVDF
ncbi:MAG: hypothetical protein ACLQPD_16340 [Desulfomonilaceae bacterium]